MDTRLRAQQLIAGLTLGVACVFLPVRAGAEPYLMVRQGAKCGDCHTNQTGGGKRTAFAHIHAKEILHDLDLLPMPAGVKPFRGDINQYISIGADFRVRNQTLFQDRPNTQGRVPENRAFRRQVASNDTSLEETFLYLQVDPIPDVLTFYIDEDVTGGNTREAFALIRGFLPWDTYVKAGRFYPTYGLRVQDNEAFIRADTGFTFDRSDDGAEIGIAPGPFFLASSVTNGTSGDSDVLATVNGYALIDEVPVVRNVLAGLSFARNSNKRDEAAFYGGANLWQFTYLAEFDLINDRTVLPPGTGRDQYASYFELDWLLFDWLNLRGTFEFLKVSGARNQTRYTVGANPFISRFLQPIIEYRINNAPGNDLEGNQPQLWFELHAFF